MITKAFAVYDTKALCYGVPFFAPTVGIAVRMFGDACNDPQTSLSKHPTDYVLFQIGEFDDSSKGTLVDINPKINLGLASDFVEKKVSPAEAVVRNMVEKPLATTSEITNGGL